ncbi:MAG: aminopeptidase P N-terminal domain-containing protein [Candidatus Neomarinimicrobiota bacterium]
MTGHSIVSILVLASTLLSLDIEPFRQRRLVVRDKLGPRSALVLFTSEVHRRNGDVNHEFRPDSDFWYLTGHPEQDTRLILTGRDMSEFEELPFKNEIIFAKPRDPRWERWNGKRLGEYGARNSLGFQAFAISDSFETVLEAIIPHVDTLFTNRMDLRNGENSPTVSRQLPGSVPDGIVIVDAGTIIHPLRHVKSPEEIELLIKAVEITGKAIEEAMTRTQPQQFEYNSQAIIEFVFSDLGSKRPGFPSIVGSGPNSTILHYTENDRLMRNGDLLLIDVGAEYKMYTADITRTIPVNGRFTPQQKEIYNYVLKVQQTVFDSVEVGMTLGDLTRIAKNYLRNKGFDRYLLHGVSHWLGLDVHDVGGRGALIKVGTVFTIEPGIYIPENDDSFPEAYRGMGIRIEDDVLMTEEGAVWLSAQVPRGISQIERIMRRGRHGFRRGRQIQK